MNEKNEFRNAVEQTHNKNPKYGRQLHDFKDLYFNMHCND